MIAYHGTSLLGAKAIGNFLERGAFVTESSEGGRSYGLRAAFRDLAISPAVVQRRGWLAFVLLTLDVDDIDLALDPGVDRPAGERHFQLRRDLPVAARRQVKFEVPPGADALRELTIAREWWSAGWERTPDEGPPPLGTFGRHSWERTSAREGIFSVGRR